MQEAIKLEKVLAFLINIIAPERNFEDFVARVSLLENNANPSNSDPVYTTRSL